MKKYSPKELTDEYHSWLVEKFPEQMENITKKQVYNVVQHQFEMLKDTMSNRELGEMRFQFFGSFQVMRFKILKKLKSIYQRYSAGAMSVEDLLKDEVMLYSEINKNLEEYVRDVQKTKRLKEVIAIRPKDVDLQECVRICTRELEI